jgi:PKD repeat protein
VSTAGPQSRSVGWPWLLFLVASVILSGISIHATAGLTHPENNPVPSLGARAHVSPTIHTGPATRDARADSGGRTAARLGSAVGRTSAVTYGADATRQAMASLADGAGPARGASLVCSSTASTGGYCGGDTPLVRTGISGTYGFQSATTQGALPDFYGASIAWDDFDGVVLFFGGLNETSSLPQNQTWTFLDGVWSNVTGTVGAAPPARYLASMAWDSTLDWVILTGGCGVLACPLNDTWAFHGEWYNYTSVFGLEPTVYSASMVGWTGTGNDTLLFGGCTDYDCDTQSDFTWSLQFDSACANYPTFPCWAYYGFSGPSARSGASLGEFQFSNTPGVIGDVVLYGGYSFSDSFFGIDYFTTLNDTWLFNASSGWTDLTTTGPDYPNTPRADATLFWDPNDYDLWMYGGTEVTASVFGGPPPVGVTGLSEVWVFFGFDETWSNATLSVPLPNPVRVLPAVADSAGRAPPVLVGGETSASLLLNDTWPWEGSVVTTLDVPSTVETNVSASITGTATQPGLFSEETGLASTLYFGDGQSVSGTVATHVYTRVGPVVVRLVSSDFFGVTNSSVATITVSIFSLAVSAAPAAVDVGAPVTFDALVSGGAGGATYDWTFSGGGIASGSSAVHSFATAGEARGNVSVNDTTGTVVNGSVTVTVNPALTATPIASPTVVDVGTPVEFSSEAAGGTGPLTYAWLWDDGSSSASAAPSHAFATAGTFIVHVWVNDSSIGVVARTITITVNPALVASASASTTSPSTDQTVMFSSTASAGTTPYGYAWTFGDGGRATNASPTHAYSSAGSYSVNAWVNDSGGGSYHRLFTITVAAPSTGGSGSTAGLPTWIWGVIAAIVILGVAVVVLVVRSRRSKQGPPEPPAPSAPPGAS